MLTYRRFSVNENCQLLVLKPFGKATTVEGKLRLNKNDMHSKKAFFKKQKRFFSKKFFSFLIKRHKVND